MIIDAQVHAYEKDHPGRPWAAALVGPSEVTGAQMCAAMDSVGVDAAILVSVFTMYRWDDSYAREVYAAYPKRFRLIKPVNPNDPKVTDTIAAWAKTPGAIAIRIMMNDEISSDPADPAVNHVLATAAKHNLPVNLFCWGRIEQVKQLALRNPDTQIVVDHVGLQQPYEPPLLDDPFKNLPAVLALAACPNVAIKISGAGTLSKLPYPYPDIWDPIKRILDAYSLDRCMWGTDWTRTSKILTYKQGVDAFTLNDRLSDSDRKKLMGESLLKVYRCDFN